jgi:hypothetical protein
MGAGQGSDQIHMRRSLECIVLNDRSWPIADLHRRGLLLPRALPGERQHPNTNFADSVLITVFYLHKVSSFHNAHDPAILLGLT